MKKILLLALGSAFLASDAIGQSPGDTIIVPALNYSSTTREAYVEFPDIPSEKIYMLYNMRCKDGLVSPPQQGQTNIGCGEWDYTCNTYVRDSSKVDSAKALHPSHIITGFSGNAYTYRNNPTYTYYRYTQQQVIYTGTTSESAHTVGTATTTSTSPFHTADRTGKSQFLWTASELAMAGLTAGNISGIRMNVVNAGSAPQYLKIKMKAVTATSLSAASPDMTGFTEVYFLNTVLTTGVNQFNFYNTFSWNGMDNILVEFSYTNPATGISSVVSSSSTANTSGLITAADDYSYEFSGDNVLQPGGNFSNFSDQISIGFWCYGEPGQGSNSILYSTNPQGDRLLNIHMPWDGQVYWDCGSGGSYDRINKVATASEVSGKWNYWVFTKNATTGSMKAYLNGTLWKSGANLNMGVVVDQLLLGSMPGNAYPFFGKMDEFSLWNTELSQATIAAWMNKAITSSHPDYSHLVAYYKFNENGGTIMDANTANTAAVTGNGLPKWRLLYGKDIFKNFTETNNRPVLTFVKGVYTQTTSPLTVTDSIINYQDMVYSYAVVNNDIVQTGIASYYQAGYTYVYNGDNNNLIDSVYNTPAGTINITQLVYYLRSPSDFQLVSFVTPYGINLDLGMQGKTWMIDVSDFAPVLKGWKKIFMNGGGQFQEQMNISFMFIAGTPPRAVKDISNLWKVEAIPYANLANDAAMEPRSIVLDPSSASFKIKTAVTGHGQQGEFVPRDHYLNINGGASEFTWQVWKECALNPIYPQGGTWIYDRAGWCPGMATDVHESVLTDPPGSNITVDYGITTATGESNYWISNQLISYGPASFNLDAAIAEVKSPSQRVEYARTNPTCQNPVVTIQNTGATALSGLKISYWVNDNPVKSTYTWSGNLSFMDKADVTLPITPELWTSLVNGGNTFHAEISDPNGGTDAYPFNNIYKGGFNSGEILSTPFIVSVKTNSQGLETSYKIIDDAGNTLLNRNSLSGNTEYRDTMPLPKGCYSFIVSDSDDDGLSFWANNDGSGSARFLNIDGSALKVFQGDFGKSLVYNFSVDNIVAVRDADLTHQFRLHPNPATDKFTIEGDNADKARVNSYNAIGQLIPIPYTAQKGALIFDSSLLPAGLYNIVVQTPDGKSGTWKLVRIK